MLQNVKKAMLKYHADMEKAEAAKTNALAALNKQFEIKDSNKGTYYVPKKVKGTEAYNKRYVEILSEYENAVRGNKESCKVDAEVALNKAKADIIIFTQKAPAESVMRSISALEGVGPEHITKEELLMIVENSKNYLACKKLAQVAEDAKQDVFIYTLADALDVLDVARKDVDWFFRYYDPNSYRTIATLSDSSTFANADRFLDNFMAGNFVKGNDSAWIDEVREARRADKERKEKEAAEREAKIEAKVNDMTEAEKLAMYLN
ncbi:MAG: hypothetical protein K6B42_08460 [Clostridia bacterium]|nr:hypothetical protein [Clostridia bacterium]